MTKYLPLKSVSARYGISDRNGGGVMDLAKLISEAISDLATGRITPQEARAISNRAGAILKVAETQRKYRRRGYVIHAPHQC
jgi:hypothetical protein